MVQRRFKNVDLKCELRAAFGASERNILSVTALFVE